jgi:hypothetical protein
MKGPTRDSEDRNGMFEINPEARGFIRKRCGGAVTIVLDFQPMMGGG